MTGPNTLPEQDVPIGHAASAFDDLGLRKKLLARLKQIAPNLSYEFEEVPFKPTTVRALATCPNDQHSQEEWSWTLPVQSGNRWILTVSEFLQTEIERLS